MEYGIVFLCIINIITFYVYGFDKKRARHKLRRIPEKVLIGLALIGGSVGALLGMNVFRHKIRKWKFIISIPLILMLQIIAVSYFIFVH